MLCTYYKLHIQSLAMSSIHWLTFLAFIVARLIGRSICTWHRLRHIPGPTWISFSKIWQLVTQIRGNWYLELKVLGDQYGMSNFRPFKPRGSNQYRQPLPHRAQSGHNHGC